MTCTQYEPHGVDGNCSNCGAGRMSHDMPVHLKFGYAHAVERAGILAALREHGLTDVDLHFTAIREQEMRHANDPTYRKRQQVWLAAQRGNLDPCIEALKLIRDGANDARTVARVTLESLGVE